MRESQDMRGKSEREDTGEGMLSSGFQLRTTGSLSQARQANHPLQSVTSGPDILSGWMERRRGANHCCFNRCIAIFPHFYSPLILCLRPSHPSGRTFHLNISSFLLFLSELSLLFLLYDKREAREWDNLSLASKASLEIFTR